MGLQYTVLGGNGQKYLFHCIALKWKQRVIKKKGPMVR